MSETKRLTPDRTGFAAVEGGRRQVYWEYFGQGQREVVVLLNGLAMLTRSLAKELAPAVRVNGVSPGAIAWPEDGMTEAVKKSIVAQIPLGRTGEPVDIANAVLFLVRDATFITGQIIPIDGGRSIGW